MRETQHYQLKQPEPSDYVNVEHINGNMGTIDEALYTLDTAMKGTAKPLTEAPMKPSIADGDGVAITDSAEGHATKRVLWSTIKGTLGQLFAGKSHKHPAADIASGILPVARGGTGKTNWAVNQLLYASGASVLAQLGFPPGAGYVLRQSPNGAPYWASLDRIMADAGGVRITTGTYVGTGTVGPESPNHLTFSFPAKLVFLGFDQNDSLWSGNPMFGLLIRDVKSTAFGISWTANISGAGSNSLAGMFNDDDVSWYSKEKHAFGQFNARSVVYRYWAIG